MLEIGQIIGRYAVEERLGEGGMGVVYRVRHVSLGTVYALKVVRSGDPDVRERVLREGRTQATVSHPHVVSVLDVLDVDGAPALLLEYVDGPTLHDVLGGGRLDPADATRLFRAIVGAVAAAHARGIVHRDLKPANILLTRSDDGWSPKIADFGLVKAERVAPGVTRDRIALGTPGYMAPEQARDAAAVDARADVFSLGCLLYELVCGQPAFPPDDGMAALRASAEGRYTPPRQLAPDLPQPLEWLIEGCLVPDPDRRIPTCEDVLEILDLADGDPADASGPETPSPWSSSADALPSGLWASAVPPGPTLVPASPARAWLAYAWTASIGQRWAVGAAALALLGMVAGLAWSVASSGDVAVGAPPPPRVDAVTSGDVGPQDVVAKDVGGKDVVAKDVGGKDVVAKDAVAKDVARDVRSARAEAAPAVVAPTSGRGLACPSEAGAQLGWVRVPAPWFVLGAGGTWRPAQDRAVYASTPGGGQEPAIRCVLPAGTPVRVLGRAVRVPGRGAWARVASAG